MSDIRVLYLLLNRICASFPGPLFLVPFEAGRNGGGQTPKLASIYGVVALPLILLCLESRAATAGDIYMLSGQCSKLSYANSDYTSMCSRGVVQVGAPEENITFNFSTEDGKMFSFTGADTINPTPDGYITQIYKVIVNLKGTPDGAQDTPSSGQCSYGNPFRGVSTITCKGVTNAGLAFSATFVTDGREPTRFGGAPQSNAGRPSAPSPGGGNPSSAGQQAANLAVNQGYSSPSTSQPTQSPSATEQVTSRLVPGFTFRVCNNTRRKIVLAVFSKYNFIEDDDAYSTQGWYTAPAGACTDIGRFPRQDFAFYANDENGREWGGRNLERCVIAQRFKHIYLGETQCQGQMRKGFQPITVTSDVHTLNLSR